MDIYLDNAATTRTLPEVADVVIKVMTEDYGNPSSLHMKGIDAEKYIKEASETISRTLKVKPANIVYTSGGTESNNHAIIGTAYAYNRTGKHLITTATEHPSVINTFHYLEQQGYDVTYIPVDEGGNVREDDLRDALREDTTLVSIMTVNNEIGTIQNIESLVQIVKNYNKDISFHTDAVQAYGKIKIFPQKLGIDLMSVSAHKFHGPKGVGFLYVGDGVKLHPYIHGGGQQRDMRSGTENVPGIAGMSLAAKMAYDNIDDNYNKLSSLKEQFVKAIADIPDIIINGEYNIDNKNRDKNDIKNSPYIISVGIKDVRSEVLLHALEDKGIYVSSGSACSSNHPGISSTLTAIGTDKAYLDSTIRFSLSRFTTSDELNYTSDALHELIPTLRRFTRR